MPCAKCGVGEAEEGQRWCAACQAAYMRDWRKTQRIRLERRHFLRGAEEMRARLASEFLRLEKRELNGNAAAEIVKRLCFP